MHILLMLMIIEYTSILSEFSQWDKVVWFLCLVFVVYMCVPFPENLSEVALCIRTQR